MLLIDAKPGVLSSCGCLYCPNCTKKIIEKSFLNCPTCKSSINFKRFINLKDKKEAGKVIYLFENQENNIRKIQQSIKIQKKNKSQYINFLEHKVKSLLLENKNLKKSFMEMSNEINNNENINRNNIIMNNINDRINNNKKNTNNNNYSKDDRQNTYINGSNSNYNIDIKNSIYRTPNIADRHSNLKKIEIKKSNEYQNSIKYSPFINKYDENLNVKNLNAQTAFEQQISNRKGNNINVNINDNNSTRRSSPFINNLSNRRSNNRSNNGSIEKNYIKQNFGKYPY